MCCSPGIEDMPMICAMRNKHHWHGSFPICLVMILVASIHDSTGVRWNTSSFLLEWFKSSIRFLLEIFGYNPSMVEPSFSEWKITYPDLPTLPPLILFFLANLLFNLRSFQFNSCHNIYIYILYIYIYIIYIYII